MQKFIAGSLIATLSFSAMAECQPVGLDQNGIQLYRCDQTQQVQQPVQTLPGQPVYQAQSQMSSTEGMVIGAIGGMVLGTILADNNSDNYVTNVYRGGYRGGRYPNSRNSYRHQMNRY